MERRSFFALCASAGASATLAEGVWHQVQAMEVPELAARVFPGSPITRDVIRSAEAMIGVAFTDSERDLMVNVLESYLAWYLALRTVELENHVPPAFRFSAILPGRVYAGSQRPGGACYESSCGDASRDGGRAGLFQCGAAR